MTINECSGGMNFMKRILTIFLCLFIITGALAGCGTNSSNSNDDKLDIVTTIFPEFDWVKQIVGDQPKTATEITMLLDNGVDLHSYQPSADDIIKISTCDLFIYVGGESDSWVDDALQEATNKDMVVINLLDVLGDAVKEEEAVEGMESEHEEDHEHEEEGEHGEEPEYDEHVWLSLRNAEILCTEIADQLCNIDPESKDTYTANLNAYLEELSALDLQYQSVVDSAANKTLLFGDRFPFRYLVDDYGIDYYAAFAGCSAETEASLETIVFLANKVDELQLKTVLTIDSPQHNIADTIVENTTAKDAQVLSLNSMQSATCEDSNNGITYLSIMESNLEVLTIALQ